VRMMIPYENCMVIHKHHCNEKVYLPAAVPAVTDYK
jgi:hypothetical protein